MVIVRSRHHKLLVVVMLIISEQSEVNFKQFLIFALMIE
jgi:hypothetical protein